MQVMCKNGTLSKFCLITSAVFQGSTLGPLQFMLHINDIFHVIMNDVHVLLADGVKLSIRFPIVTSKTPSIMHKMICCRLVHDA